MAVHLDKIQSAELVYEGSRVTRIRTAIVDNLDTSSAALMLEDAFVQLSAAGITYASGYPSNPSWRLQTIQIVPLSGVVARAILRYSTVDWGTSIYLIRDTSYAVSISTQLMPGPLKTPFRVSYTSPNPLDTVNNIPEDAITLQIFGPMRSYQITQISFGAVPTAPRAYFRYVNSDPFLGMPPAYWLFTKFATQLSKYNSSYMVDSEILTKQDEDWSSYGTLQSRTTGKYADVTAVTAAAQAKDYSYGIIYPSTPAEKTNGLLRAGPYRMTAFASIFPSIGS